MMITWPFSRWRSPPADRLRDADARAADAGAADAGRAVGPPRRRADCGRRRHGPRQRRQVGDSMRVRVEAVGHGAGHLWRPCPPDRPLRPPGFDKRRAALEPDRPASTAGTIPQGMHNGDLPNLLVGADGARQRSSSPSPAQA